MNFKHFVSIVFILNAYLTQNSYADVPFKDCATTFSPDKLESLKNQLNPQEMAHLVRIGEEISMIPEILAGHQYNDNFSVSPLEGESPVNIRFIERPTESLSIYRTNPNNPPVLVVGLPSQKAPQATAAVDSPETKTPVVQKPKVTKIEELSQELTPPSSETINTHTAEESKNKSIRRTYRSKNYSIEAFVEVVDGISKATMRWRNRYYVTKNIKNSEEERKALTALFSASSVLVKEYRRSQTLSRETIMKYGRTVKKLVKVFPNVFDKDMIRQELNLNPTNFLYTFVNESFVFATDLNRISGGSYRSNILVRKLLNELFPITRNRTSSQTEANTPSIELAIVEKPNYLFTRQKLASILKTFPSVFSELHSIAAKLDSMPDEEILKTDLFEIKTALAKPYGDLRPSEILLLFGGSKSYRENFPENKHDILFNLADQESIRGSMINIFIENLNFLAQHPKLLVDENGNPLKNFNTMFEKFVAHYGFEEEYFKFFENTFVNDNSFEDHEFQCLIWLNSMMLAKSKQAIENDPNFSLGKHRAIALEKLTKMPEFAELSTEEITSKIYSRIEGSKFLEKNIDVLVQRRQSGLNPNNRQLVWITYMPPFLIDTYLRAVK